MKQDETQVSEQDLAQFWHRWATVESSVKTLCRRYTSGNDSEAHEDLYQEVLIRSQRGYRDLREKERFPFWVHRIADNVCKLWLRATIRERNRRRADSTADDPTANVLDRYPDPRPDAENSMLTSEVGQERGAILHAALRAGWLTEKEFLVIQKRLKSEGRSWEAIGSDLGLGKSDCASAHSRGIAKVRAYLFAEHQEILGGTQALSQALNRALDHGGDNPLTPAEHTTFSEIVIRQNRNYHKAGWRTQLRDACEKVSRQFSFDNQTVYLRRPSFGGRMRERNPLERVEIVLEGGRRLFMDGSAPENPLALGVVQAVLSRLHLARDNCLDRGASESLGDAVDTLTGYQVTAAVTTHDSLEEIALLLERNHIVILIVNAGGLWGESGFYDAGATNHLVLPIGCFRNLETDEIEGFAAFQSSSVHVGFVSAESLSAGWLDHGGIVFDAAGAEILENLR